VAPAAFLLTAVSIGLLAADEGGYFHGAWQVATPLYAAVAIAMLAGAAELRLPAPALVMSAGLAGLAAFTALSVVWSSDRTATLEDVHLVMVYVAGGAALILLANAGRGAAVAGGVVAATAAVATYSMVSRLYPGTFGMYTTGGGYGRLYQPIGYWNGLGAFVVIGIVLALGFAARGGMLTRMFAAAALIPLAPTLYLTFSRGALVGLGAGLVALVALDTRRVQLIVATAAGGIGAAGAVLAVHSHPGLTTYYRHIGTQTAQGARTAARIVSLVPLGMGSAALLSGLEARFTVSRAAKTIAGAGMVLAACAAVALAVNRFGNPVDLVHSAVHTFEKPAPTFKGGDLNLRLLSLSPNGRVIFWKAAWHDFTAHPAIGSGAGTFARYWLDHRPVHIQVRNAHSLYLETLAELGVAGLAIVLVALLPPLWAGMRQRSHPLAAPVMAAYIAFLVHTGGDWTWQLPGVGLAAVACGAACIGLGEEEDAVRLGVPARAVAIGVLLVVAVVGASGA
jgi:O-antigen ligase/polysaccharide polymerase Wzy-like membrane protein